MLLIGAAAVVLHKKIEYNKDTSNKSTETIRNNRKQKGRKKRL